MPNQQKPNKPDKNKQALQFTLALGAGVIIILAIVLGSLSASFNHFKASKNSNKPLVALSRHDGDSDSSSNKKSKTKHQQNAKSNSSSNNSSSNNNSVTTEKISTDNINMPSQKQNQVVFDSVKSQLGNGTYNQVGAFIINNNKATLKVKNGRQIYAANTLDKEKRPSVSNAYLTKAARQYKNRSETSNGATNWKPNGYHQLSNLTGKYRYAYNRGHLLAYALVGNIKGFDASESNHENIVTQTSWSNQAGSANNTGQNYYEGLVRKALDQNKTVGYQVTPIYQGSNIVPSGMHIQAKSTDNSLDFNVFIPNTQGNISINYATGFAKALSN